MQSKFALCSRSAYDGVHPETKGVKKTCTFLRNNEKRIGGLDFGFDFKRSMNQSFTVKDENLFS